MKTYKLVTGTLFALLLIALTATMLFASPTAPGSALKQTLGNAPILPRHVVKAHSDEWNDVYFNRNVASELPYYFELESRAQLRGGLAGLRTQLSPKPIAPKENIRAHSDAWNARYFDRNVNTRFTSPVTEYLQPGLRRGGLAK